MLHALDTGPTFAVMMNSVPALALVVARSWRYFPCMSIVLFAAVQSCVTEEQFDVLHTRYSGLPLAPLTETVTVHPASIPVIVAMLEVTSVDTARPVCAVKGKNAGALSQVLCTTQAHDDPSQTCTHFGAVFFHRSAPSRSASHREDR